MQFANDNSNPHIIIFGGVLLSIINDRIRRTLFSDHYRWQIQFPLIGSV
jgi:hypothetical protein